jgi:predicted MFS family arabinose efflux permease
MQSPVDREASGLSVGLTLLLAVTAGISAANMYLAQPLIGLIGPSIGLQREAFGLVVTLTQIGYACGLLLLVPLGDFLESRKLMVVTLSLGAITLLLTSFARSPMLFLVACFIIGLTSVTTHMAVPLAAHLADPKKRGRQVATIVSGLLTGILFGRPIASLIASANGWRTVFIVAAMAMASIATVLWFRLPRHRPHARNNYLGVLRSLFPLVRNTPILRRRMVYQTSVMFAFSVLWTAIPLELSSPHFGFGQPGIALFSLVGAAGALSAPIAGRLADAGKAIGGTAIAILMVSAGLILTWPGSAAHGWIGIIILGIATILLDGGVQAHQAFAMKVLFDLAPAQRSRINALFIAVAFLGAAVGSAASPLVFAYGGWPLVALLGVVPPLTALCCFVVWERRQPAIA